MKRITHFVMLGLLFASSLSAQEVEFGIASYYSDLFQGKPTASGELYDKAKLTAAHKSLPFGTMVVVTRLDNDKSVEVRVNDRGPFISGRIIELSREAASRIDLIDDGSARVKVEIVSDRSADSSTAGAGDEKPAGQDVAVTENKPREQEKPVDPKVVKTPEEKPAAPKVNQRPDKPVEETEPLKTDADTGSRSVLVKKQDYQSYDLYEIQLKRPEKKGYGVQVAALTSQDALFRKIADLQGEWFSNILVSIEKGSGNDPMYKVLLGPFSTETEAQSYKKNLKKNKQMDGFVVDLSTIGKP